MLTGAVAGDRVEHAILGCAPRLFLDLVAHVFPRHVDRRLNQIPDDLLHVPAHIPDLSELCGLDLQKRRFREPCQATGNFRLSNPRRADHEDVLRIDFVAYVVSQPLSPATGS